MMTENIGDKHHPIIIETWCKTNGCRADVYRQEIRRLKAANKWMRREIERVGVALFTGANGYVGTEDDLKAVGQFVEGVCETMEKDQIENTRLRVIERESAAVIAMARSFANFPSWLEELEAALVAPGDLSKLTTQQKPDMESMLRASPSCGMDGCLWEREEMPSPVDR